MYGFLILFYFIWLKTESNIRHRALNIDYTAPTPHELTSKPADNNHKPGFFPRLQEEVLLKEPYTPKWVGLVSHLSVFCLPVCQCV